MTTTRETSLPGKQSLDSPLMLITKLLNINLLLILNNGSKTLKILIQFNTPKISAMVKKTTEVLLKFLVQNKKQLERQENMLGM